MRPLTAVAREIDRDCTSRAYLYHSVFRGTRRTSAPRTPSSVAGSRRCRPRSMSCAPSRCSAATRFDNWLPSLPTVISRRTVVRQMVREGAEHPDKAGVMGRALRKLGRGPRKALRLIIAEPLSGVASVNVFVAKRGNEFMRDIAGWIAEAARADRPSRRGHRRSPAIAPTARSTSSSRRTSSSSCTTRHARICNAPRPQASASAPSSPARRGSTWRSRRAGAVC